MNLQHPKRWLEQIKANLKFLNIITFLVIFDKMTNRTIWCLRSNMDLPLVTSIFFLLLRLMSGARHIRGFNIQTGSSSNIILNWLYKI